MGKVRRKILEPQDHLRISEIMLQETAGKRLIQLPYLDLQVNHLNKHCFMESIFKFSCQIEQVQQSMLGHAKNAFSSQTIFWGLATTFSHYLGLKHCRKPKIENFYEFFHPDVALRSFTT